MDLGKYEDPARSTRRWITLGLTLGGALAGAMFGLVVTPLGKAIAGAQSADLANYLWNAGFFGILGGLMTPGFVWSTLRKAPLWRTICRDEE